MPIVRLDGIPTAAKESPEFRALVDQQIPGAFRLVDVEPSRVHVSHDSPGNMAADDCRCVSEAVIWLDAHRGLGPLTLELTEHLVRFAERQLRQAVRVRVEAVGYADTMGGVREREL